MPSFRGHTDTASRPPVSDLTAVHSAVSHRWSGLSGCWLWNCLHRTELRLKLRDDQHPAFIRALDALWSCNSAGGFILVPAAHSGSKLDDDEIPSLGQLHGVEAAVGCHEGRSVVAHDEGEMERVTGCKRVDVYQTARVTHEIH